MGRSFHIMTTYTSFRVSWVTYACLFASGSASLVYELIWFRHLTLFFGASLYALSAVLCAFMIGLAGGAWIMGRLLTRGSFKMESGKMIRVYGLLEGLIGIYALCFPIGLRLIEKLYPLILAESGQVGLTLHLLEFFLSTLLMFPATLLMGATLPLLGCWASGNKSEKVFTQIALLYGANTIGAVFGCLFTQFFAIRVWGVQGATWLAVALNVVVFMLCYGKAQIFYAEEPNPVKSIKPKNVKNNKTQRSRLLLVC
jgi:spermidine synthase